VVAFPVVLLDAGDEMVSHFIVAFDCVEVLVHEEADQV
jgi:hypothetical protein